MGGVKIIPPARGNAAMRHDPTSPLATAPDWGWGTAPAVVAGAI